MPTTVRSVDERLSSALCGPGARVRDLRAEETPERDGLSKSQRVCTEVAVGLPGSVRRARVYETASAGYRRATCFRYPVCVIHAPGRWRSLELESAAHQRTNKTTIIYVMSSRDVKRDRHEKRLSDDTSRLTAVLSIMTLVGTIICVQRKVLSDSMRPSIHSR